MVAKSKNQYDNFLIETLTKNKYKVSTELIDLLVNEFKITNVYARKIVERTTKSGFIISSTPLTFSKGQFAYFLPGERLSKDKIKEICKKYRPALYRLLESIDTNDGIVSYYEALKISASPLEKFSTKADYLNDLIELLQKLDLVYQKIDKNAVKYIVLKVNQEHEELLMTNHFAKMSLDAVFVKDILDWFIKSNILDNIQIIFRNKNNPSIGATQNNLLWDAFGYTKTTGINPASANEAKTIEKQTLVVFDVVISRDYEHFDLDGFLSRIQINLNSVNTGKRKILPIVVYKSCSAYVLNSIKSLGFLCYDIGSIYGSNIFSILENISKLQINQNLLENNDFEKIIENTLDTIKNSGQEDQLKALKGTLFEVMMYQILKHQYPNADIKASFYYSKKTLNQEDNSEIKEGYEYDYIIKSSNPKEIIVVELKGYHSNYQIPLGDYQTKSTVKWFFNKTLPFIKEKFKTDIGDGYTFKGAYITSSKFTEEALENLNEKNQGGLKPKNLDVYYDREKLLNLLSENDFNTLKVILEKFY